MKNNGAHLAGRKDWSGLRDWITTEEAAEVSGYHVNYIRRLMRQGKVTGRKSGLMWWIDRDSLRRYLDIVKAVGSRRFGPGGIERALQEEGK